MLRAELISSVYNISNILEKSKATKFMNSALMPNRSGESSTLVSDLFSSFAMLSSAYNNDFSDYEKEIVKQLGLEKIFKPEWWSIVQSIATGDKKVDLARSISREISRVRFAQENLPLVVGLLSREYDSSVYIKENLQNSDEKPTVDIISLFLPEEEGTVSSARRVANSIDSIILMYSAFALWHSLPENGLSIVSCDSGSDKQFDFTGLGEIVKEIKEFLLSAWSQIVFYKEKKFRERIEAVSSSLPVLEKLSDLEKDGKITRESSEMIRRNLISGIEKFLSTGCNIPEMNDNSVFAPRLLLKAENTLLLEAPREGSKDTSSNNHSSNQITNSEEETSLDDTSSPDIDKMTPEEMARELRKVRGSNS